ncbi:hypothetical protein B0H11DRAFT_1930511 [Mycena galericulata]|nr:hypothetical protein B0H11DRAFT_1930511 [Mycena galericulata]
MLSLKIGGGRLKRKRLKGARCRFYTPSAPKTELYLLSVSCLVVVGVQEEEAERAYTRRRRRVRSTSLSSRLIPRVSRQSRPYRSILPPQSWAYRSILPPQLTSHLASALICALLCVPPFLGLPFNPPAPVHLIFTISRLLFQSTDLQLTSDQMSDFVSQLPNDERQSLMRKICRLCDPLEAAEATFNLRLYKKHAGMVYVQYRMNQEELDRVAFMPADQEADYIDLKIGETSDIERRRDDYTRVCVGENIGWAFYYETQHVQLLGIFFPLL